MTIIKASTRANISRGIFSFVTARLLPIVVRQHHRSLDAVQGQQDRDLKDAREEATAALAIFKDAKAQADKLSARRLRVMIAVAEERRRINTYIKED